MRAFEHSPACGAFALKPAIGVALFLPNGRLELAGSCGSCRWQKAAFQSARAA